MVDELPPNEPCSRCGAENIASADRCLECGAVLVGDDRRPSPIGPEDAAAKPTHCPGLDDRSWDARDNLLRAVGVATIGVLIVVLGGGTRAAGKVALGTVAALGLFALGVSRDRAEGSPAGPSLVVDGLDKAIRGAGCLIGMAAALVFGAFALLFGFCTPR